MPLFDYFSAEGKLRRLSKALTEKYGPPENRQKAIATLSEQGTPEALSALLLRFTITSDPSITDAEEKQQVFELVVDAGDKAIGPLRDFLRRDSVSWALRALAELLPRGELLAIVVGELERLGAEYTRDPEKKVQLISWLAENHTDETSGQDPRVVPALLPFLDDMSDDVKLAALRALVRQRVEAVREPILESLVRPDQSARVRQELLSAIAELGLAVQGYREKVEALLPETYFVDKAGTLKRR